MDATRKKGTSLLTGRYQGGSKPAFCESKGASIAEGLGTRIARSTHAHVRVKTHFYMAVIAENQTPKKVTPQKGAPSLFCHCCEGRAST